MTKTGRNFRYKLTSNKTECRPVTWSATKSALVDERALRAGGKSNLDSAINILAESLFY